MSRDFPLLRTELRANSEALEPRLEAPIIQFMIGFWPAHHTRTGVAYHRNVAICRLWGLFVCLPLLLTHYREAHNPCVLI